MSTLEDILADIPRKYYVVKGKELRTGDTIYISNYKMVDYSIGNFSYVYDKKHAMIFNEKHYDLGKIKNFFESKEVKDYLRKHLRIIDCHLESYYEIKKG